MGEGETITGHLMAPGYSHWAAYGLDDIWEMVRHEDGRVNWTQYYAWLRMARLCEEEADQLEKAVNKLVELWPDRPGSAAEAFKTFVGGMVRSMRETGAAAAANADALYGVTAKLLAAKAEIAALMQQRVAYIQAEQQMAEHTRAVTRLPGAPIEPPPPVPERPPDNWWEYLDHRARNIMAESDNAIGTDAARFQAPRLYDPPWQDLRPEPPPRPGSASGSFTLPPPDAPELPPTPRIDTQMPTMPGSQTGDPPVLDGQPNPTPAPGVPMAPIGGSTANRPSEAPPLSFIPAGAQPPIGTGINTPRRVPSIIATPKATVSEPSSSSAVTQRGPGRAGGPPPVMSPPLMSRPSPSQTAAVAPGGRAAPAYGRRRAQNANDLFVVKEGVPSTIVAPDAPIEHEPGPGVIGLDR